MSEIETSLRALRLVAVSLILGPVLFLGVAVFLRGRGFGGEIEGALLTWVSLGAAASVVAVSLVLPRPRGDLGRIRAHFVTRLALVEGGALFATVAYLLEGEELAAGTAVACLGLMAFVHFPGDARVRELLEAS